MRITTAAAFIIGGFIFLLGTGCETTTAKKSGSLTGYRTFFLAELPTGGPTSDPSAASRLKDPVRDAVIETLSAKGYQEVAASAADFVVTVQTEFSKDGLISSSEQRLLRIEFHDRAGNATLWSAQKARSSAQTLEPELVRKHITEMLASVPTAAN